MDTEYSAEAHAAVFECPSVSGSTVFQDRPCEIPVTPEAKVTNLSPIPVGMHASWFEQPFYSEQKIACNDLGCVCGTTNRNFSSDMSFAVADSLYLDGNWHRYEEAIARWQNATPDSALAASLKTGVTEAACEIQLAQQTLLLFGSETFADMRSKARNAEDRGSDYPELCVDDTEQEEEIDLTDLENFKVGSNSSYDAKGCERYEQLMRYRSMVNDAKALQGPRKSLISTAFTAADQGG